MENEYSRENKEILVSKFCQNISLFSILFVNKVIVLNFLLPPHEARLFRWSLSASCPTWRKKACSHY